MAAAGTTAADMAVAGMAAADMAAADMAAADIIGHHGQPSDGGRPRGRGSR
jgi:hypothetical protein